MIEKAIILTNNPKSEEYFSKSFETIFLDGSLMDVLIKVRDCIHKGHRLLTHPLMGSVKPNQTPYKTVAISFKAEEHVDFDSIQLIENSIDVATRLIKSNPIKNWPDSISDDFKLIDFDLIYHALIK